MNSNQIQDVADPTSNQDAATKKYVDDNSSGGLYLPLTGGTLTGPLVVEDIITVTGTEIVISSSAATQFDGGLIIKQEATGVGRIGFYNAGWMNYFDMRQNDVWFTHPILAAVGSVSAPGVAFAGDENTGMYKKSNGVIGFSRDGILRLTIGAQLTGREATGNMSIENNSTPSSTIPTYSFYGDTDTGMYRYGTNHLGFATGGVVRLQINSSRTYSSVPFRATNGSVGAPSFSFEGDTNSGLYNDSNDGPSIVRAGVRRLGVVTTISFYDSANKLRYRVGDGANSGYLTRTYNYNGTTTALDILETNIRFLAQYSSTSGSSANLYITSSGNFRRSTSARRYKTNILDAPDMADIVLRPVTFDMDEGEEDGGVINRIGMVADDLADQDARIGVFGESGEIDAYDTNAILAVLAAKVNRLEAALGT